MTSGGVRLSHTNAVRFAGFAGICRYGNRSNCTWDQPAYSARIAFS